MSQKVIQSLFSYSMYHKIPTLFELITEQAKPIAPRCLNVQLTFLQKSLVKTINFSLILKIK